MDEDFWFGAGNCLVTLYDPRNGRDCEVPPGLFETCMICAALKQAM